MSLPAQATIQRWWEPRCTGPWLTIRLHGEGRVTVRPAIGDAVMALDACLRRWDYQTRRADTGAYNCRLKVSGNGWSMHAYGTAPDINWTTNPFGSRLVTDMPAAMTRAITEIRTMSGAQVWQWGGYWRGNKDAMHFEIVCSPAAIRTGIDPRTVPGHRGNPLPAALPSKPQPEPESEEDDVKQALIRHHGGEIWHYHGKARSHCSPSDVQRYRFLGVELTDVSGDRAASEFFLRHSFNVADVGQAALRATWLQTVVGRIADRLGVAK